MAVGFVAAAGNAHCKAKVSVAATDMLSPVIVFSYWALLATLVLNVPIVVLVPANVFLKLKVESSLLPAVPALLLTEITAQITLNA